MNISRAGHISSVLTNSNILLIGGFDGVQSYLDSAELYVVSTETLIMIDQIENIGIDHTGSILTNEKVSVKCGLGKAISNTIQF